MAAAASRSRGFQPSRQVSAQSGANDGFPVYIGAVPVARVVAEIDSPCAANSPCRGRLHRSRMGSPVREESQEEFFICVCAD
jgi:hypothetical protein